MASSSDIFPPELLDKIFVHATSSDDFPVLRALALVSQHAATWTYQKLRRQVVIHFQELPRFLEVERPELEWLEIRSPPPFREYSDDILVCLEDNIDRIPQIWPNLCRLTIADDDDTLEEPWNSKVISGFACLPNLKSLYVDCFSIVLSIQPPFKFSSLTHLYCLAFEVDPLHGPTLFPVSSHCFPVLTHVTLQATYYQELSGNEMFLDFDGARNTSAEWLTLPRLLRLIFVWDEFNPQDFTRRVQEYLGNNNLDDRVVFVVIDSCEYFGLKSSDKIWELGEEAYQRRKDGP